MAEILQYTPTVGMTSKERTIEGYYSVFKNWVEEIKGEIFDKWFNVSYDDDNYKIILTPKNETLSIKPLYLRPYVTASSHYLEIEFKSDATNISQNPIDIKTDKPICIYSGEDFFIGSQTQIAYGIFKGKKFSGEEIQCIIGYRNTLYCYTNNEVAATTASSKSTVCTGVTPVYIIQKMIFSSVDVIFNNIYYLDGGITTTLSTNKFKVGSETYFQIMGNIIYKLGG